VVPDLAARNPVAEYGALLDRAVHDERVVGLTDLMASA
jgi:hypothetical protein